MPKRTKAMPQSEVRHVRLFRNGRNQAIRIPRDLELPGTEAVLYRDGGRLVLEPVASRSLKRLIAGWRMIDTDWPHTDDPPPESFDLGKP